MRDGLMELTDTQRKRIVNNVRKVFLTKSIDALNKQAYRFITLRMGFIAHYDLYGFRATYEDLRDFALTLQTSEYSRDRDYQLRGRYTANMVFSDAEVVREIVRIAEVFEPEMVEHFGAIDREHEVATLKALATKHGFGLVEGN
jgi:hypothetical protein